MKHVLIALVSLLFSVQHAVAAPPESTLTYGGGVFSYITSADLTVANPNIETAFIVVHGSDLNVADYWRTINLAAQKSGNDTKVITIAPHYKVSGEAGSGTILPHELLFTDEGWLRGDPAVNNLNVTSFAIIDYFVDVLANRAIYPHLKTIVITGHSAGGQLTQRYALGSNAEDLIHQVSPGIHFRYLPANPGAYAYLTPNRLLADKGGNGAGQTFGIPANPACAYNDYKFGLDHLNEYMSTTPKDEMVARYLKRDVTYFLGEADTLTDPADIDEGCEAVYQGLTRFARGTNFKNQLDAEFPQNAHQLVSVPGVGHTEYGMYLSPNGMKLLFPGN